MTFQQRLKNLMERADGPMGQRQRSRQFRELSERAKKLHTELVASENAVAEGERRQAEQIAGAHAQIEEFVESVARLVDIDKNRVESFQDPELYDRLVYWEWHGVKTVDQAKDELTNEIARRSVGKTDLALLLSSIDHTAFSLFENMPDSLKPLHGEELVKDIVTMLVGDNFAGDLVQDKNWVSMRTRWVRLGWRNIRGEEEFSYAFIRACAERIAELHERKTTLGAAYVPDTVLDNVLNRVPPEARDHMIRAFGARLDHEYELLPKKTVNGYGSVVDEPTKEVKTLLALESDRAREAVLRLAERELGTPQSSTSVFGNTKYSDHEFMRIGRISWETTYASGMTDNQVWELVAGRSGDPAIDALVLFQPKWAVHAFQRLMTSHTFAAALMCSDVQREVLDGIEKQWDAFMVVVPNGMLIADGIEVSRVLVATYSFGAQIILLSVFPDGEVRAVVDERKTLPDLLASDESELDVDSQPLRCLLMAKRLVAGLLLHLQQPTGVKVRKVEAKAKSKGREAEPEHRIVTIGTPLTIDCRASVKEYIERGTRASGRKHGPPTVQVMVRGHYRMQPCGPRSMERKKIWIQPFWRGPEAALIQTRAKVPT